MEFVDIVTTYESELAEFSSNDVTYFEKFLKFDNESSILNPSIMNKVLVFGRTQKSDIFENYAYWKEHGRVPKKNTGICVLNEENKGTYVFAKGDTVVINPVLAEEPEVTEKETLEYLNISDELKDLEAIKRISSAFDIDELVQFVTECISIMENKESHFSENIALIYEKYKASADNLFGWIVPTVYEAYNELRTNSKEKKYGAYDGRTSSDNELSDGGNNETEIDAGTDKSIRIREELLPEPDPNMDSKESVYGQLDSPGEEIQEERGANEGNVSKESQVVNSDKNDGSRADGDGANNEDTVNSVNIPTTSRYDRPYFLGNIKRTDGGRFLSPMSKYDASKYYIYGVFPNYKECSEACVFFDRLTAEEKKKYYFDDDILHSDEEYAEKQKLFEADFKEYFDTMIYLRCDSKMYHNIIDNAIAEKSENTIEEVGRMYLLRSLSAHSNINEFLYDAFNSNLSDEALEEFVGTVIKADLEAYNDWADGGFVQNDDAASFDMMVRPHGICNNISVTDLTPINISTKDVVNVIKEYIKEDTFEVKDHSMNEKHGGLLISESTYKKYRKFQSKYGYKDKKACIRQYSFRCKDINSVTDESTKSDFIELLIENVLYEQEWNDKYALMDLYEEEHNAEKRIDTLKRRGLCRFDYCGCLSVKDIENTKGNGSYRLLGYSIESEYLGIKVYQNGKYVKYTMSWEQADNLISDRAANDAILNHNDEIECDRYFNSCFDDIRKATKQDSLGLPEEYLTIQENAYKNDRLLTPQEYKELSIMSTLCNSYNERHRKYLKEAMLQPNLSKKEKIEFLQMYMKKSNICGFPGSFDGWFQCPDENGFTITNVNNILTPFSCYGSQKVKTYEYVDKFDVSWEEALPIFETVCCNDNWIVKDREPGCNGRLSEGTIEAYNQFKAEHNFVELYDTSNDLDEPLKENITHDKEDEQMDMFTYMKGSKSKSR